MKCGTALKHRLDLIHDQKMRRTSIVAIVGPTAVGKTALSLELAKLLPAEIVGVDSRQVYRHMEIGTAKPILEEQSQAPHHLIDIAEPADDFSLAAYLVRAHCAIQDIQKRGRLPLLVGGTGQYLWALLEEWRVPSVAPDRKFREDMEALAAEQGNEVVYNRLRELDPESAAVIDARNLRRVIRALEVHHQTGIPFSKMRGRGEGRYNSLVIGLTLPRDELYRRIDQRVDRMMEAGWLDEVRCLLERGVAAELPSMSSVGYRELAASLQGEISLEDAVRNIKSHTRKFARRQSAWFRLSDQRIRWLQSNENVVSEAYGLTTDFLW